MTRILQVRRGTAMQNNNFTGLTGELSFDTDARTLRVHDGQMLGGYALARTDQITGGGGSGGGGTSDFDINSVPAEFWQSIMQTYAPAPWQITEGRPSIIANVSNLEYIFNIPTPIKFAWVVLICQTAEAGYAINDVVSAFGIGDRSNPLPNIFSGTDGQHVRLLVGGQNFWVSHKTSGTNTTITNSNWKAKFIVWY